MALLLLRELKGMILFKLKRTSNQFLGHCSRRKTSTSMAELLTIKDARHENLCH